VSGRSSSRTRRGAVDRRKPGARRPAHSRAPATHPTTDRAPARPAYPLRRDSEIPLYRGRQGPIAGALGRRTRQPKPDRPATNRDHGITSPTTGKQCSAKAARVITGPTTRSERAFFSGLRWKEDAPCSASPVPRRRRTASRQDPRMGSYGSSSTIRRPSRWTEEAKFRSRGPVAQRSEQRTHNPSVAGSNPARPITRPGLRNDGTHRCQWGSVGAPLGAISYPRDWTREPIHLV
jgi:hypothetical protein